MKIIKYIFILFMSVMASAATFEEYTSIASGNGDISNAFKSFGKRLIKRRSTNQEKRDISLSYAATNINNKEGTQVKTITVIKNLNDKQEKLKIDPKLHKNENWADAFKDNFDSYGIIPDVPDVDDLFEYVNNKHAKEINNENKKANKKINIKNEKSMPIEMEKPVTEVSSELSEEITENLKSVEKIKGDAELLPKFNSSRLKVRESLINLNYSTPGHSVHQYFENYVQLSQSGKAVDSGYDYAKPCVHTQPIGSVTVATPSGRTYNIPINNNNSYINPYLAPAITRRPQINKQSTPAQPSNVPTFPINSLVPPIQPQQNNSPTLNNFLTQQQNTAGSNFAQPQPQIPNISLQAPTFQNNFQANQQQPQQNNQQAQNSFISTSQRPYVSPNIRSGLGGVSRGPSSLSNFNGYQNGQPGYRINTFNNAFRKLNNFRSRGIKY